MLTRSDLPVVPSLSIDRSTGGEFKPADYAAVREATAALCGSLETEDYVLQSMPDASPAKWHLAHTTWFFEHFLLEPLFKDYRLFRRTYNYLFNSYYYSVGDMHKRAERGLLSRPTVSEIKRYRAHVDRHMTKLIRRKKRDPQFMFLLRLGLNHEQQHQELILTDLKHAFWQNPLKPAVRELLPPVGGHPGGLLWSKGTEGSVTIGHQEDTFCFDNERPAHEVTLRPHELGSRLITNAEYRDFVRDGGYETNALWLSDGWATVQEQGWKRPLYWTEDCEQEFTLGGMRDLDVDAPVCHISYYEADAFATWAGARLPSEAELETAARKFYVDGNFAESTLWQPAPSERDARYTQFYG
ncbi:MAG: ergothioneine biosynthesis protein EgtB, partial [Halioglobus sp.]|nr:ergothioneine biosynthesis protein EgtB [Halioglobus sp.]